MGNQISLQEEIVRALGGSAEASSLSKDVGLYARTIPIGGHGGGCWVGSGISKDHDRASGFANYMERIIAPGLPRLVKVETVCSCTSRAVATMRLLRGIRLSSPAGKKLQISAGTAGLLVVGRPDPQEDVCDIALGLGRGSCLLLLPPHRGSGLLLAARPTPGSVWWPVCPRTGPRPSRRKPAGQ